MRCNFVKFTACIVSFFLLVAMVFYMIFFFGTVCEFNVEWVKVFFLYYGLVALLIPLPMAVESLFIIGCSYHKPCTCHKYDD